MLYLKENIFSVFILLYLSITFAYSAFEKLFDLKASIAFYKNHFHLSLLKNYIPFLIGLVILLELITTFNCLKGTYQLIFFNTKDTAMLGLSLSAVTLTGLMLGQRIAKDYPGAMNITVYFILTIIGLFFIS